MRVSLGQPVIIENVAGASGTLALGRVARALPDGYTISHGSTPTHVFNGAIFKLPFDVEQRFPTDLADRQRAAPDRRQESHRCERPAGIHRLAEGEPAQGIAGDRRRGRDVAYRRHILSANLRHALYAVPYRGAGPAMQDLIAGQIDMMIDPAANTLPQVRADRIKAFAVTAKRRLAAAPDIPTVDEAGLPGFYVENWQGFFAPKGTPAAVVARLNAAVVETLADPAVRARLVDLGQEIFPREQQTPEALAALLRAGIEKWWPIIKAAGIKPE